MIRRLTYIFFGLLYSIQVFGQMDSSTLSGITITANGYLQATRNTGRNVLVIPGTLLLRAPVYSIDELLRFIPGVEVQLRGPQGVQGDIVLRGGTFQQVLVLIDGLRVNDPLTGHFNSYLPIDPMEIDRIEILKGPAAAVWGSEAVGGVIQIFTKTFSSRTSDNSVESKMISTLEGVGSIGENQLRNLQARWFVQKNKHRFSISGTSRNSRGVEQRGIRSYFYLNTLQSSWQYQFINGWNIRMRAAVDVRRFAAQNFYTSFLSDTATQRVMTGWTQAQLSKSFPKGKWQADLGYKLADDHYLFRPTVIPNLNKMGLTQLQVKYQRNPKGSFQYQAGFQYLGRTIRSNDRGNHQVAQGALFATSQYQLSTALVTSLAMRVTADELYGTILVPQFSLSYATTNSQWRISAGRSFRDADFTERYNNYNKSLVSSGRIGNPQLSPEDAWQAELGYDLTIQQKLFINTSLFYRDHRGLIDWVTTPYILMPRPVNLIPTGTYALAKNVERVQSMGAELDLRFVENLGKGKFLLQTGILLLRNQAPSGGAGFYLNGHAKFLLNGLIQYQLEQWDFSLGILYKKRNPQQPSTLLAEFSSSYFVTNAKIQYQFRRSELTSFMMVDNLFNTSYSDLLGVSMPGRWLSVGLRARVF
ncbi:MAG: TonB-dependent receptor plug domain-containing protein [Chitinophagaceae bacterium]